MNTVIIRGVTGIPGITAPSSSLELTTTRSDSPALYDSPIDLEQHQCHNRAYQVFPRSA